MPLGVNLNSLTKVLECAEDDDLCTLKATDDADVSNLTYEAKIIIAKSLDSDTLGIPDTDYDARVTMPFSEFSRIVRDLSLLGESVRIELSKEGVRFASDGEAANGNVLLKQTEAAREKYADLGKVKEDAEGQRRTLLLGTAAAETTPSSPSVVRTRGWLRDSLAGTGATRRRGIRGSKTYHHRTTSPPACLRNSATASASSAQWGKHPLPFIADKVRPKGTGAASVPRSRPGASNDPATHSRERSGDAF
jgi:hypothetical protein